MKTIEELVAELEEAMLKETKTFEKGEELLLRARKIAHRTEKRVRELLHDRSKRASDVLFQPDAASDKNEE